MPDLRIVKKIFCACLAGVMLLGVLSLFAVDSSAVTPTYYVSSEYKSTEYYKALKNYKLTGDERYDVVSIAMTQYGYHEGESEADMHGGNLDGDSNFAEYNRMYGKLDNGEGNGLSYGYSWCAAFVSWCLRQARVPTSTVETFVSCSKAVRNFRSKGLFKEANSGYIPKAGDIIFFVKPEDAALGYIASHVGLVVGTDSENVYTIEGNTDYCNVCQKKYPFDSEKLVGYAVPNYASVAGTVYDFPLRDDARYPGKFIVKKDNLEVCREGYVRENPLGTLKEGDVVDVLEVVLGWGLIDFGGAQGWISLTHAEAVDEFTVTLDSSGGQPALMEAKKVRGVDFALSDYIPTREGYRFVGWTREKDGAVSYLPESVYSADEDITLYAVWTEKFYIVKFVDYDGREISSGAYTHGAKLIIPAAPVRAGDGEYTYEFAGWGVQLPETVTAEAVYTATYRAIPIVVTTEEVTTEAPEVTTEPPAETTEEVTAEVTEDVTEEITEPVQTVLPAVTTEPEPDLIVEAGCFASAAMPVFGAAMAGVALCFKRKKKIE